MKNFLAIGLMSGTSLDGIDALLARITTRGDGYETKVIAHIHHPFPRNWAATAHQIQSRNLLKESSYLGEVWSEVAAAAVRRLLKKARMKPNRVDVIGAHGQTLVHLPKQVRFLGHNVSTTIQVADLALLAQRTGIDVVGNFRTADIAAGGQGAPLAPHAHKLLFASEKKMIAVQNLGGIGNVTLLKKNRVELAFDTGPANSWIDTVVQWKTNGRLHFDRNGALAQKGRPNFNLIQKLLSHRYFRLNPPKSAGWEDFGPATLTKYRSALKKLSTPDAVATVTFATAMATAMAYRQFVFPRGVPAEIIVAGGGAKNELMLELLQRMLLECTVTTSKEYGIDVDQVEALAFALLAVETIRRRPGNEPRATGAKCAVICGQVAFAS